MQDRKKKRSFIKFLPIYGCISTGIIYVIIGMIALLSFLKIRDGGADESSMIVLLNEFAAGKILVWIILSGTISYIIWRIYESLKDPYGYGKNLKGIGLRTAIAFSTIADILIAYSVIQILLGGGNIHRNGQPEEERNMVQILLQERWGIFCMLAAGSIVLITAVVQLFYGITKSYSERMDMDHFGSGLKLLIHFLACAGYIARSVILGIIGFFFIKAGILKNAQYVVNTDKAFDFIGDHLGNVSYILVAAGTVCYGFFMFTLGGAYDADKD